MNGFRRHGTLALLALVAFLASLAVGVVYNTTAIADPGPDGPAPCVSGSCDCKMWCPSAHRELCWGLKVGPECIALCIPDPSQFCDIE
ncbi:MAG: hypothetical protein AB1752_12355 [Candidatus Zixiibacteriota bacterium]